MASTITRFAWTDDAGTPASPAGTGTVINNAQLQLLFDRIDAMWTAAVFNPGGVLDVDGGGTHTFDAIVVGGGNVVRARNTSNNASSLGGFQMGNDGSATSGVLYALSSAYAAGAIYQPDGVTLEATRSGGLTLAATNASGTVRFTTGSTLRGRVNAGGRLSWESGYATSGLATPAGIEIGTQVSTDRAQFIWGDGTGYSISFGAVAAGAYVTKFKFFDTGLILVGDGVESSPSYTFLSDPDTGWWWSAPATVPKMSASVGGNEILRIESENTLHKPTVRIVGDHSTDHCAKLIIERKASATTAPGVLALQDRNGTTHYVWVDTTGDLRVGTTEPKPTNGDTVGTVVGTQV